MSQYRCRSVPSRWGALWLLCHTSKLGSLNMPGVAWRFPAMFREEMLFDHCNVALSLLRPNVGRSQWLQPFSAFVTMPASHAFIELREEFILSTFLRKTARCLRVYYAPHSPRRSDAHQQAHHCPLSEFLDEPCQPHHMLQLNRATLPGWWVLYSPMADYKKFI